MKCSICGNTDNFIMISTEQYDVEWQKERNVFLLTNSKILSAKFYCASEQCTNKCVKVENVNEK